MPHAEVAKMAGRLGVRVERPDDIHAALDTALIGAGRVSWTDVLTDPEVPTLPPHIELDQARKLTETMLKGDAHGGQMMKQGLKDTRAGLQSPG